MARGIHLDLINWKSLRAPQRGSPGPKVVDSLGRNFGHGTDIISFIGHLEPGFTINMEFMNICPPFEKNENPSERLALLPSHEQINDCAKHDK
jgi:hypothetical protein